MQKTSKSSKKKVLFEEEEEGQLPSKSTVKPELKINEDFAKKFEHNKNRELLDKGKKLYGEQALLESDDEEESEDEDDDGDLINAAVQKKFFETIAMISSNDPKLKET